MKTITTEQASRIAERWGCKPERILIHLSAEARQSPYMVLWEQLIMKIQFKRLVS
jgi:hypothetical protein